jgi:hypothetical protein
MKDRRSHKTRRLFVNAYGTFGRVGRSVRSWWMRDPLAIVALMGAFKDLGFEYAQTILNSPADGPDIRPFDLSIFRPWDLIIQVTRPPLHDKEVGGKKSVPRSFTSLEEIILFGGLLQTWFRTLSRGEVVLLPAATDLAPEIALLRTQEYVQYKGSMYKYVIPTSGPKVKCGRSYARTAAYLIYTPHLWAGGPAFLTAFGLSTDDTLTWCTELATRSRHLLLTTPFAMAEMSTGAWPECADSTIFTADRPVTILGKAPMPSTPTGGRKAKTAKLVASL